MRRGGGALGTAALFFGWGWETRGFLGQVRGQVQRPLTLIAAESLANGLLGTAKPGGVNFLENPGMAGAGF
ncbi:MAG: hypothetical protein ACI9MR_000569 [Myxococcota bacterium]|jgi:hypothetical protein